jgi:hypothetical protein
MLTKLEVTRRPLGVALDLFIHDRDPISVHCLMPSVWNAPTGDNVVGVIAPHSRT